MPTNSSSGRPRRLRRWLLRLALLALVALLLAGGAVVYLLGRLPEIAKWGVERAFPGAEADFHSVQFLSPNHLEVRNLVLKSKKDGATLLTLDRGSVVFEFDDLRRARIGEVRLVYPSLTVSPRIVEALGGPARGEPPKDAPLPNWSLRRLVCDYAEIQVAGYGNEDLAVMAKAAFDLKDVAPAALPDALHEILFWDVKVRLGEGEPFAATDVLRLGWTFRGLLQKKELASLIVQGGNLTIGRALRELTAASSPSPAAQAWKIGLLDVKRVQVRLDDERAEISDITFELNIPELKDLPLAAAPGALSSDERTVEIADIEIASPFDPFTKVLTVRSAFLRFTLAGLVRQEFESLAVLSPTIYISEDLFWYMEDAQKRTGNEGGGAAGWIIKDVMINYGQLVIGSGGRTQYGLPLSFSGRMKNVSPDNLATLQIQRARFRIPEKEYSFPDYQLEFFSKEGRLQFSYPPESGKKNLVGTVYLDDVRWRQFRANNAWLSVTFDREGINGEFGFEAYRGYLSGGFSFFFQSDSPWAGWIAGKTVDTKLLTDVLAPQNFSLNGPLNFKLQMDAVGKEIDRVKGDFQLASKGVMKIGKLNDLIANIPNDWLPLKQDSTRIALEALRDFPYTGGKGDFWFVQKQGVLQLRLQGPAGSRNFDVVLHSDDAPDGRWKKLEKDFEQKETEKTEKE